MQKHLRLGEMGILVDMIDPFRIKRAGSANDPVDFVSLGKQKFCEVRSILAGDSGDERLTDLHVLMSLALRGDSKWLRARSLASVIYITIRPSGRYSVGLSEEALANGKRASYPLF